LPVTRSSWSTPEAAVSVRELGSAVAEADIVVLLQQHRGYDVDALAALATRFLDTRGTVTPSDRAERL
jgi:UDP-N-acetyl-D-mannosaminuronate dehydrogenase